MTPSDHAALCSALRALRPETRHVEAMPLILAQALREAEPLPGTSDATIADLRHVARARTAAVTARVAEIRAALLADPSLAGLFDPPVKPTLAAVVPA